MRAETRLCLPVLYSKAAQKNLRELNGAEIQQIKYLAVPTNLGPQGEVPLRPIASSLMPQDFEPSLIPIISVMNYVFVPEALVPVQDREKYETVIGVTDGLRSMTIHPESTLPRLKEEGIAQVFPVPLYTLGIQGNDSELIELSTLGVKGAGTIYDDFTPDDDIVRSLVDDPNADGARERMMVLVNALTGRGPVILPRLLDSGDLRESRAIGSYDFESGELNLEATQDLINERIDLKRFPTIYTVRYPLSVLREIVNLAKSLGIRRNWGRKFLEHVRENADAYSLAQSVRLVFSQIRAFTFTDDGLDLEDSVTRFNEFPFSPQEYQTVIAPRYRRDFRRMVDVLSTFTRVSNFSHIYSHWTMQELLYTYRMSQEEFAAYPSTYLLAKDLALATSGVYVADGDQLYKDYIHVTSIQYQMARAIPEVFKTWIRLMTHLKITSLAAEGKTVSREEYGGIEREEFALLLEELQQNSKLGYVHANDTTIFVPICLMDDKDKTIEYVEIRKADLQMQYQADTQK